MATDLVSLLTRLGRLVVPNSSYLDQVFAENTIRSISKPAFNPIPVVPIPVTSTTTSTTTSALFSGIIEWSSGDVCTSPEGSFLVYGDGLTFCDSTQFSSNGFLDLIPGNSYTIKYGIDKVNVTVSPIFTTAAFNDSYPACPFC